MKGFVPTPDAVVDLMVEKLFRDKPPRENSRVLDPGCGRGAFIAGVLRWCSRHKAPVPTIVGVESDPAHVSQAASRFAALTQVQIRHCDFLAPAQERFDYIIGNPPYVPITGLTEAERALYREGYSVAKGRFDLYLLFYEQALSLLQQGGRLVFITPEKYLYVDTARPLRDLLGRLQVEELHFLDEQTFGALVTYPLISSVLRAPPRFSTSVRARDASAREVNLVGRSSSWLPLVLGVDDTGGPFTLADICSRISCGVATGADAVFVLRTEDIPPELRRFAHPTISGRLLVKNSEPSSDYSMLTPYTVGGELIHEDKLGALHQYLNAESRRRRLMQRTCVARKPWYAFHETPPLGELLRPKLLCKDITASPFFVADYHGRVLPRHSVYYIVPSDPAKLDELALYLNSPAAQRWLVANCQRAAKGFLRLQSEILKRLPIPVEMGPARPQVKRRGSARNARSA